MCSKIERIKIYANTPKGRSEIPEESGAYNLRNNKGVIIHTGVTNNLKRRIKEHHYDTSKPFASVEIISISKNNDKLEQEK